MTDFIGSQREERSLHRRGSDDFIGKSKGRKEDGFTGEEVTTSVEKRVQMCRIRCDCIRALDSHFALSTATAFARLAAALLRLRRILL
jgi:hypothetical protein